MQPRCCDCGELMKDCGCPEEIKCCLECGDTQNNLYTHPNLTGDKLCLPHLIDFYEDRLEEIDCEKIVIKQKLTKLRKLK